MSLFCTADEGQTFTVVRTYSTSNATFHFSCSQSQAQAICTAKGTKRHIDNSFYPVNAN